MTVKRFRCENCEREMEQGEPLYEIGEDIDGATTVCRACYRLITFTDPETGDFIGDPDANPA